VQCYNLYNYRLFRRGEFLKNKTFVYTGCENLEVMTEAKNYNKYLIGIIKKEIHSFGKKKPKILDFGAGSGTYADMLKAEGTVVDCLEPDSKLQKVLTKKGYKVSSDAANLRERSYDVIYALNVMEHIEDDYDVFAQLTKALKKGGVVIIYVPAFKVLWSPMDNLVGHYRRYKKSRLQAMATKNNLKIIKLGYCDPLGFAAALVYKASRPKSGVISSRSVMFYDRLAFPLSKKVEPVSRSVVGKNVVLVAQK